MKSISLTHTTIFGCTTSETRAVTGTDCFMVGTWEAGRIACMMRLHGMCLQSPVAPTLNLTILSDINLHHVDPCSCRVLRYCNACPSRTYGVGQETEEHESEDTGRCWYRIDISHDVGRCCCESRHLQVSVGRHTTVLLCWLANTGSAATLRYRSRRRVCYYM